MPLTRSIVAGPRAAGSDLPRRLDVAGHFVTGGQAPWTFETLAGGRDVPPGQQAPEPVAWRLRTGFGATEVGCIVVGLALALAATPGAGEAGSAVIRRLRLTPGQDVLVVPELVHAATGVTDLPLAVVVTTTEDCAGLLAELAATTRWSMTTGRIGRP